MFAVIAAAVRLKENEGIGSAWWASAFLLGALGFGLTLAGPQGTRELGREFANIAFLLAYGCCHAGARIVGGRSPLLIATIAGAVLWIVIAWIVDVAPPARMLLASLLIAIYSAAIAAEFLGSVGENRIRRAAGLLTAGHALFFAVRVFLGPTFGITDDWSEDARSACAIVVDVHHFRRRCSVVGAMKGPVSRWNAREQQSHLRCSLFGCRTRYRARCPAIN
jgi:hypothetical protein